MQTITKATLPEMKTTLPGPDGRRVPLVDAEPVHELFRG